MKVQERVSNIPNSSSAKRVWRRIALHSALLTLIGIVLFCLDALYLTFDIHFDVPKYQCYATAFWQGVPALHAFSEVQCIFITHPATPQIPQAAIVAFLHTIHFPSWLTQFVAAQSSTQPFHALPHEYPMLTLLTFSLPLLAPAAWYQPVFAIWMILAAALTYAILNVFRSSGAALAFALYLVTGAWSTAIARFDLIPALLTLGAVICADRSRWKWAFALLALATLTKFYPLMLVVPFLIGLQSTCGGKWYAWRRWTPPLVFVLVCLLVEGVSLALSVEGTLAPLGYFGSRPIQVESFAASLIWLTSFFGQKLTYEFTFGSLNVIGAASNVIGIVVNILLVIGLLSTWWLQVRGKLPLASATLLTLLIVIFTGKVFSPQYLIWVAPLVAYVGEGDRRWLVSWGLLGILTSIIYPFVYRMVPLIRVATTLPFYPLTFTRNLLLLGIILAMLSSATRRKDGTEEGKPDLLEPAIRA